MQWNEDTFLRRLNAKDERAYEELFRAYYRALVRFSFDYVKVWEDAEDVVQRVLVALWEVRAAFATGNALRNFLYNGVRNASLNCLKHRRAEHDSPLGHRVDGRAEGRLGGGHLRKPGSQWRGHRHHEAGDERQAHDRRLLYL